MKFLKESYIPVRTSLEEGVADKYAAKKFGIPDPDDEYEKKFQHHKSNLSGKVIGEVSAQWGENDEIYYVVKNPKNLRNFEPGSRGAITISGDLYVVSDAENVIHTDILKFLKSKGLIKGNPIGWEELEDQSKFDFITVQRVWDKNVLAIGESYVMPPGRNPKDREEALKMFKPYFDAANKKNPGINFIINQVRKVAREILSPEEYELYKIQGS